MNRVNLHIFFVFIFLSLSVSPVMASTQADSLSSRGFNQEKLSSLNESSRYDYDRKIESRKPNPILNFFAQLIGLFAQIFGSIIGYLILAALIIGLVWILAKNVRLPKRKVKVAPEDVLHYDPEQDIQVIDYSGLLEEAIANKNYRLAIRYLYIMTLQKLQNADLIQWHKEKTNRDYYYELPHDYQPAFNDILRIYEYVWYGEFDASESLFGKMRGQIEVLDSKTSGTE